MFDNDIKVDSVKFKIIRKWAWIIFRTFILTGVSFLILYPIFYMITSSIRPSFDILDPTIVWIPSRVTYFNIIETFKAMDYIKALLNTLQLAIVCAVLQAMSTSFIGYGFARFEFKYRELIFMLVIFTIIVPPQIIGLPMYLQFRNFDFLGILTLIGRITGSDMTINMLDTMSVFYLPALFGMGLRSGFFIYIYRQFYRGFEKELEEAALIDGCGPFKTYYKIVIPNSWPAIIPVFLFSTIWHWNDYYNVIMFFAKKKTLSVALATLRSQLAVTIFQGTTSSIHNIYDVIVYLQTGSLLYLIPLLILYIFLQRKFTESIQATGIKA